MNNTDPQPDDLLHVLYMSFANFTAGKFTTAHALAVQGQEMIVATQDSGLRGRYVGIIKPISETITQVGRDEVLNECVIGLRLLAFN